MSRNARVSTVCPAPHHLNNRFHRTTSQPREVSGESGVMYTAAYLSPRTSLSSSATEERRCSNNSGSTERDTGHGRENSKSTHLFECQQILGLIYHSSTNTMTSSSPMLQVKSQVFPEVSTGKRRRFGNTADWRGTHPKSKLRIIDKLSASGVAGHIREGEEDRSHEEPQLRRTKEALRSRMNFWRQPVNVF